MTVQQIAAEALALSKESRAFLADTLLESLDHEENFVVSERWIAEVKRRTSELDSGTVIGIPAEKVISDLRRELL